MKKPHSLLLCACLIATLLGCKGEKEPLLIDLVNPLSQRSGGDSVSPETHIPFGNLRFSPDIAETNRILAFSYACYGETDTFFPQTIRLMPTVRRPQANGTASSLAIYCQSTFSPKKETAIPGFYGVTLDNGVAVDFSLTKHCGMHSFRFPKGQSYGMLLDLSPDSPDAADVKISLWKASNRTLQGYRLATTPSGEESVYFCIEFSQNVDVWTGKQLRQKLTNGQETIGSDPYVWIDFGATTNVILVKTGLSLQTEEEAFSYLQTEIPHWSFDKVKREASQAWRKLLSRVRIKSTDTLALKEFYTALYHAYPIPLLYFDIRETYKDTDGELEIIRQHLQKKAKPAAEEVFSALGLRPEPNNPARFRTTCPRFSRIVLRLEQDRRFVIKTNNKNASPADVESILLNGNLLQHPWVTKQDIVRGGNLEFIVSDKS